MTRNKEQKVGIFVDVQNMYYSAKNLYKRKVNFKAILNEGVKGRKLIRAIAYVIKADVKDESNFFDALTNIGFEVKAKELQVFFGGAKKGDWDVGIAMDMMRIACKIDTAVLVSGDGDFSDLLHHLKSLGCRTEVIAFGKTASSKIKKEADYFVDMDKNTRRFLIPNNRRRSRTRKKSSKTKKPKQSKTSKSKNKKVNKTRTNKKSKQSRAKKTKTNKSKKISKPKSKNNKFKPKRKKHKSKKSKPKT
ncbi:MAG: hypothetical protein MAG795_00936 [Candidatus Woesearchaeota archaeon]|nr:hypothetical protein [Candidatus Woesearchaeota archaeon]